jgi:hypothetical protein
MPIPLHCIDEIILSFILTNSEMWSLIDIGIPPNILYPFLRPTSIAENIIFPVIKCELCSWRNFHPDAGVPL